jgi:hypothetical protein
MQLPQSHFSAKDINQRPIDVINRRATEIQY